MEFNDIFELIMDARQVLAGDVHRTPLTYSSHFSRASGKDVYLKLENLQKTGSFKVRGAYFKIKSLMPQVKGRGVVAASSGNHAQGVAYAASRLGVKATIVMPETAPPYKVNATRSYGAEVILHGRVYDDAYLKAVEISRETGAFFVHPFDDPHVIAGQGTIGIEIAEDLPEVDTVLVPVGGGGLIAGIALAVKLRLRDRSVRVIGVEPETAPKLKLSLEAGEPVKITPKPSLADGVITKGVGRLTYSIISRYVDQVVTVGEDDIAKAMYLLLERAKLLAEGAGALPLAALLRYGESLPGEKIVAVISGGNADLTTLYRVILRGLMVDGRIAKVTLILKDSPGILESTLRVVAKHRCNILDIRHDRFEPKIRPGYARVEILMETPSSETLKELIKDLSENGIEVV